MKLSKDFYLREFLRSQTAARHGIDMTPPPEVLDNLKRLAREILQPLRDDIDAPITITSGYRPPRLNALIGGSPKSQHMLGEASDIVAAGLTPLELAERIAALGLPYHQLILEYPPDGWVHVSAPPFGQRPRGEVLTARRELRGTTYTLGLNA